jgi:hypothetical protein
MLPVINLVGDYQLDNIRLVDSTTGATRLEATPSSVPVTVFDEVLISRVTSRPLTYEEILEKGIYIDESNFRTVEFEIAFVLDGKTIPVTFPVVAPRFTDSTEIIPAAELEEKLKAAAALNRQIASEVVELPPEFETSRLNFEIQGINFQAVDEGNAADLSLTIPPIPALMVIPGNIGYLNQFFSVQIFTENAAPMTSKLMVSNVQATLVLPTGADLIASTNYSQPGDDPLRFARIGPDKIIKPVQTIMRPGADGELGTTDDLAWLNPGESGEAEFLVEGLQEGLHVMDLDLVGDLWGLAAGVVKVKGKAAGAVLVRNPKFSFAFSHPRTVRAGEPYEASVTILNTGITPANLVRVTLNKNSISGAVLETGQTETVELGNIEPGQTVTATYKLRAQRTGAISFSNLTTSDDSVVGRFRLSMGIDERGVALSPDSIAMPSFVNELPPDLLTAANRVLGQALSIATAGQLPTGVVNVARSTITRRVLELAEAGQRIRYGDPLKRVLPDLLRDWQGARLSSDGFDQLLRVTQAGAEWRAALMAAIEAADPLSATDRLADRAPDMAGLGQTFLVASANTGRLVIGQGEAVATSEYSAVPESLVYAGTNGSWAFSPTDTNFSFAWTFTKGPAAADIAVLLVHTNGTADQLRWKITGPVATASYRFDTSDGSQVLLVDLEQDGVIDQRLTPERTLVQELPPTLIAVEQDLTVVAGRPANPCLLAGFGNYGTVLAVVFSKPMTQATAGASEAYFLDDGNGANSVQIQPSGRVALINLREGVSAIKPRALMVLGATDARGNAVTGAGLPVRSVYPDSSLPFIGGVSVSGRVLKGDGAPAVGVPVTLTYHDEVYGTFGCESWVRRASQVMTDQGGNFDLDFVMAGIPYTISATDTSDLSEEAIKVILEATVQDTIDRQKLEDLANSAATKDTLLGLFAATSLPQAIAKAEGLDRAVMNDFVGVGSVREGQQVPIALRFRGRGTVVGVVVSADGQTPIPDAAVNLFPDPDSREKGRGLYSDANGQFAFFGVPLGVYTVDVSTSDKRSRTVAGLLDTPGQSVSLLIALPSNPETFGSLSGRVFEADNLTPHANARVFIGQYSGESKVTEVVRIVDSNEEGYWEAENIPLRSYDLVAVTFDGRRKGVRHNITPALGQTVFASITLEDITRVYGRVQYEDGRPAPNALVAGGIALVRADANGNFELEGVPVGSRQISAGLERNPSAGIDFPRLGSASVNVIAGQDNYVVVKLRSAGRIFGKVVDAQGTPMAGVRVAIPVVGGFYWTDADEDGNYSFENLGLGGYTLSAPANATAPQINEEQLMSQIRSGDEDQILAAFEEAVRVFVGADDPLITGELERFRPSTWGYTSAKLTYDGQSANANIRFLVQGTVSGRVLNDQGVPIGARVRLTGLGPSANGAPATTIRGERDTDPATGEFSFPLQLLAGAWTVQAASPFYPEVLTKSGFTTEIDPDVRNIELRFSPIREVNGRIAGHVYNPDGTLAGGGVKVKIDFSADYEIQTDTNGFFDTQIMLPANRGYTLDAFDPASGLRGRAGVGMTAGITNFVDIHLLTRNSSLTVQTRRGNGQPAIGATIQLSHGTYPYEANLVAISDTNGLAVFSNLWEGNYAAYASYLEGSTRVSARAGISLAADQAGTMELRLSATGSLEGTFVKTDRITPVEAAQITIGSVGYASTDSKGYFRFDGMPLGTYRIVTSDPVTGARASAVVVLSIPDKTESVLLVEGLRGEVNGFVRDSYGVGFVAGARVTIGYSDGLTPSVTVTTGPDGRFSFPGSPMGSFSLSASYTMPSGVSVSGHATGLLQDSATVASVTIELNPLGNLPVLVLRPDGTNPAPETRLWLSGRFERDADPQGNAIFADLALGNYTLRAISRVGGELRNGVEVGVSVSARGTNALVSVVLPGVGAVNGQVLASDGVTPVSNAEVTLTMHRAPFSGTSETALSDSDGRFTFIDIPTGAYVVTAAKGSLAASRNGVVNFHGQTNELTLRLGDSGTIRGRLVRADGVTPAGGLDVWIDYASQSENPGRAFMRTPLDGTFEFSNVPLGAVNLSSAAPDFSGLISRTFSLVTNGQILDVGALAFDEALPSVVAVNPTNGAIDIAITNVVQLLFSEALDTNSVNASGIFVRTSTGRVASAVSILPDTNGVFRLVQITPKAPLVSKRVYEVIVLSGDLQGPGVSGSGPRDLVGRVLAAPFSSLFSTADNDPPVLLSLFPSNNAVQIDPRAVPRLSFNEALRATNFSFVLSGPAGPITGDAAIGVNAQVLSFVPRADLLPNQVYTLVVSNVFDLAGNRAADEPFISTFSTLDTLGPEISLRIASNASPVAGYSIPIEAVLTTNEPGVTVHFTQDLQAIGVATNAPFIIQAQMPAQGSTILRAIATDANGNDGPIAELTITVLPDLPPAVTLSSPSHGTNAIASGSSVSFEVAASVQGTLSRITAVLSGGGLTNVYNTNASPLRIDANVPATATPQDRIELAVEALDTLGRSSGVRILSLPVSDGTPPVVAILAPPDSSALERGQPLELTFTVRDNNTNATVKLVLAGELSATQQLAMVLSPNALATNTFTVPLTNVPPSGGSIVATVTATDPAGYTNTASRTYWLPAEPPSISFTRIQPADGPLPSGSLATIELNATYQGSLREFTVELSGGAVASKITTNGAPLRVQFRVREDALAGEDVLVTAEAIDAAGRSSGKRIFTLPVSDGTLPQLAILSPAENVLLNPPEPLVLVVRSADNSTNLGLSLVVTGDVTFAQSAVVTLVPKGSATNLFTIPLTGSPPEGGQIGVAVSAIDSASNTVTVVRRFWLPGAAPTLEFVRVTPASGPIPSGSQFVVDVVGSIHGILSNFTAQVTGPVTSVSVVSNGATLRVSGTVPADTLSGGQIRVVSELVDGIGRSTGQKELVVPVSDGTRPSLAFLSPVENTILSLLDPLQIELLTRDNSSDLRIDLEVVGNLSGTQTASFVAVPNEFTNISFTVPITNVPALGGPVTAWATARDASGNVTTLARTFWLPGPDTTVYWNRRALGQILTCTNNGATYTWPNNNLWSQSTVLGDPCGTGSLIERQPSNWTTPEYPNATNLDVFLTGLGGSLVDLDVNVQLHSLTIQPAAELNMRNYTRMDLQNLIFQGNGELTKNGCCSTPLIVMTNGSVVVKSGGTGTYSLSPEIRLSVEGGSISSASGVLALPGVGSTYRNTSFNADSNAVIVLAPANNQVWLSGNNSGTGQGVVSHRAGILSPAADGATLNLSPGMFQWTGGSLALDNGLTNAGAMEFSGNGSGLVFSGRLYNSGTIRHTGTASVSAHSGAYLLNLPEGIYSYENSSGIYVGSCCSAVVFENRGLVVKAANVTNTTISTRFNNIGGQVDVQVGTLTLANDGSSTDGLFTVAKDAVLDITGGQQPTWAGLMTGSGLGSVSLGSGTLRAGGVTLAFAGDVFKWSGGTLDGTVTNLDQVNITGSSTRLLNGRFVNRGLARQDSSASLGFTSGSVFDNWGGYRVETNSGMYVASCCNPTAFNNYGSFERTASVGDVFIGVPFNNYGTVYVHQGSVSFGSSGLMADALYRVDSDATLYLVAGSDYYWKDRVRGRGAGMVNHYQGTLRAASGFEMDFPSGMFHWTGGAIQGPGTNLSYMSLSGTNPCYLESKLENLGVVRHVGTGNLGMHSGSAFWNRPGAVYDFETDTGLFVASCCNVPNFYNQGIVRKSDGTNQAHITDVLFNNMGGEIQVLSGRLVLRNNGSSQDGALSVAAGAALDLTGGRSPAWSGTLHGSGEGRVELSSGQLRAQTLTLDFANNLFQWSGGELEGLAINTNQMVLSGTADRYLQGTLINNGVIRHVEVGRLGLHSSSRLENWGLYRSEAPANIFVASCCNAPSFINYGRMVHTGEATTEVTAPFHNRGGLIEADTGVLRLRNSGTSSNGQFIVSSGGVVDITGGEGPTWAGLMSGYGTGTVSFASGNLWCQPSVTLDFEDNVFHWTGGTIHGSPTNVNVMMFSGGYRVLDDRFDNEGIIRHTGAGNLGFASGATFLNHSGAIYRIEEDTGFSVASCCTRTHFINAGLFHKSGGTNVTRILVPFESMGGQVQVDVGRLVLENNGVSAGGSFAVAAGASVDLTGGSSPTWSGSVDGTGEGRIELASGSFVGSGLTLNFTPGLFHWGGGNLTGTHTNANTIQISASSAGSVAGTLFNRGRVIHSGTANLGLTSGSLLYNLPGGEYQLQSDAGIYVSSCCSGGIFQNAGVLRKQSAGNSTISAKFNNEGGSIVLEQGSLTLSSGDFTLSGGTATFFLGGRDETSYGRLILGNKAYIEGSLRVVITNGFQPEIGDQFKIISANAVSGTFTNLSLPTGFTVSYDSKAIFLVVTSKVSQGHADVVGAQQKVIMHSPGVLAVGSASAGAYTIWVSTNLAEPYWELADTISVTNQVQIWQDPQAVTSRQRFYKVLPAPGN